jgi:hypothetical protein
MTLQPLQDPEHYGWNPADSPDCEFEVPADLAMHYRMFRDGYFGYVCPCCRCVWPPGWGPSIPRDFRAHIRPYLEGKGCFFEPKAQAAPAGGKR